MMRMRMAMRIIKLAICSVVLLLPPPLPVLGFASSIMVPQQRSFDTHTAAAAATTTLLAAAALVVTNDDECDNSGTIANCDDDSLSAVTANSPVMDRRALFRKTTTAASASSVAAILLLGISTSSSSAAAAVVDDDDETALFSSTTTTTTPGSSPNHPIVVIGGGGKTGKLITELLAQRGLFVRCVTRSGRKVLDDATAAAAAAAAAAGGGGGGGNTGRIPTSATTTTTSTVTYAAGDVTKYDQMQGAVRGASGVIFAASASGSPKKNQQGGGGSTTTGGGGDPAHVDYLGVYLAAKACLEEQQKQQQQQQQNKQQQQQPIKFVLLSAGTITRPDSLGFKATNSLVQFMYGDKIMDYKIAGEAVLRDLYSAANAAAANKAANTAERTSDNNNAEDPVVVPSSLSLSSSYVVVRPGALSDAAAVGPALLHVSQGDVYTSEVSRHDVAQVTVAALFSPATDCCTFEVNQASSSPSSSSPSPSSVGQGILTKVMSSLPDLPKELVHTGATSYSGLLDHGLLLTDAQMRQRYPSLVNDFRGDGIAPLESLLLS